MSQFLLVRNLGVAQLEPFLRDCHRSAVITLLLISYEAQLGKNLSHTLEFWQDFVPDIPSLYCRYPPSGHSQFLSQEPVLHMTIYFNKVNNREYQINTSCLRSYILFLFLFFKGVGGGTYSICQKQNVQVRCVFKLNRSHKGLGFH